MVSRVFSLADQQRFAELSGDFNPLHVDPLASRRSLFGRAVVHGVHLALWALDSLLPDRTLRLANLSVSFPAPVGIGEDATCAVVESDAAEVRLVVESGQAAAVHVSAKFGPGGTVPFLPQPTPVSACSDLGAGDVAHARGDEPLTLDTALCAALFPRLSRILPPGEIAHVVALTRIVGMRCPGLHSVFAGFDLAFDPATAAPSPHLAYETAGFDQRFGRAVLKLTGAAGTGRIVAFLRPEPQAQPTAAALRTTTRPDAFRAIRALVVGGSRGIGEVCAKMLAAGGADVRLTYRQGRADAEHVVREIREIGGTATAYPLDAANPGVGVAALASPEWFPTHVFYFATPPISVGRKGVFSSEIFARFCDCYVEGFAALHRALRAIDRQAPLTLFYPSSIYVETPPLSLGEYAAAKAAGEALCRFLAANDRRLRIHVPRLPRLPTDQTANLQGQAAADMVATVSRILAASCPAAGTDEASAS